MPQDLFKRLPISLAVLQALAMWNSSAYALPTGEAVVAGQATFQRNDHTLRIDQGTKKVIVNWQSFNIAGNEAVNLFQPDHGMALFRILGPEASQIFGSFTATGSVFLVNPNGVLFAPGSRVDVGSLVATTMQISDANFMAGNYQFYADPNHPDSSVVNQGVIRTSDGGYLVLLGNTVENSGTLQANNGSVVLGSAQSAMLDFYGDGLVKVNLSGDALSAAIEQTGNIYADGGAIQLASNARTAALNVDGVIQANSLVERNGVIRLEGGTGAKVKVTGKLLASGNSEGTTGGSVTVTGEQVALLGTAVVDVSGQNGGGTALIGGDYQGKNAAVQNSRTTYIGSGASINADAVKEGDGGKVVVWSDDTTRYYGNISAKGGMLSGNGGFVEVSGKQNLDFLGGINVGAAYGFGGRVLLDPQDILLNTSMQPSPTNNANGTPDIAFADAPAAGTTTVQITDVTGFSELFLQATRNITVANAITMGAGNSVRLEANNNITLNTGANMAVSGAGSINLKADADAGGAGALTMNNATLTAQQGGIILSAVSMTGTGNISTTGAANQNGGNISLTTTGGNMSVGAISANGGTASANNAGRNAGSVTLNSAGTVTTTTIAANGTPGVLAGNRAGGNGGAVLITGVGGVTATTIGASGGTAVGTNANGGNSGSITINNSGSGNIQTTTLTSQAGNAVGTGTGGTAGSIALTNTAGTGNISTTNITTTGATNAHGGNVLLSSLGNTTVTGTITTSGGAAGTGVTAAGRNAGTVTITGVNRSVTNTINANGGNALGTDQTGGNAGLVSITGSGTLGTAAINSRTGNATGLGASGTVGGITLNGTTVTAGALTTSGNNNGNAGNIGVTSTTGNMSVGAIAASGGTALAGTSGRNAGSVTLNSAGTVTATTIAASGTGGTLAGDQAGGNGAAVSIIGVGGITATTIGANGGAAAGTNANGGNAGSITLANSGSGNIQTTTLTSQAGNALGTGTGGTAGSVSVTNTAAGNISTTNITTTGGTNAHGGNVLLSSLGNATVTGTITTNGGGAGTGVTAAGRNAGTITITGVDRSVTGAINAVGGNALGTDQAGGNAGLVSITGSGTLGTAAINSRTGNATGVGAGGTVGGITLNGTTVTAGALTTTGNNNGNAGNIGVASTTGNMSVGAIAASGGTALTGNAGRNAGSVTLNSAGNITGTTIAASGSAGVGTNQNGGNAGSITLDAGGATPNINLGGNITATGGNRTGTGTGGTGGAFWAKDATTNTANVTVNTAGGTGAGVGGNIRFDGTLNEDASARSLTLTAGNGAVLLAGGTATNALTALTSTSTTSNTLGSVQTKGSQIYNGATNLNGNLATLGTVGGDVVTFNSPVTLTGNSSITTAGGAGDNLTIGQTINGNFNLALNAGALGTVTTSAIIGGTTALNAFSATGNAVTFGRSVTASSIFGRSTTGDLTLNTGGTVLNATGTGNALELVTADQFLNNVGAGALNASNGAGRFLVWSQNPANDTRGGLVYNFKQYNATYGVTTVADSNFNNNGFLFTTAPTLNATVSGVTKQYNGTVAAALTAGNFSAITGTIDGDTVLTSALPTSGNYDTANAGTGKTINVTGTANGTNGAATVYGYQVGISSAGGTITKADISVSTNDVTKTYNGSTDMTGATGQGAVLVAGTLFNNASNGGALDSISGGTFAYTDKNFGIGNKTVTVNGVTANDGNAGGNYNITYVDNTTSTINKANITLSTNNVTKTYNGSTDMTGATGQGAVVAGGTLFAGDSLSGGTFAYTDKNFGLSNKTVTTSGVTVTDGVNSNNYNVSYQDNTTSTINKKDITAVTGITAADKTYDGNTTATLDTSSVGFTGIIGGESLTVGAATGAFNSKDVLTANTVNISGITLADGADLASNYNLTNSTASTSANITTKDITAVTGITAADKTYDGNTTATLDTSGAGFTGIVAGETLGVTGATGTFNSKDVLTANTVNITGITLANSGPYLASNYNLTNSTASDAANITTKNITAVTGITASDKIYDGNTTATLDTSSAGFTGIVAGESLTVTGATGAFNSKNVLTANTVAISGIALADGADLASNYNLTNSTASTGANITAKDITAVTGITAADKTYDGNTTATLNTAGAGFTGIVGGESLTVGSATGTFNSKNVVSANTVNITGITLADGADLASNYNLTNNTASDAAVITAKDITAVTGITANNKVYDGNTTATLNTGSAGFTGIIGGESLTVGAATGTFNSKDVVTANTVAISGITLADGADLASNYNLTTNTASTSANITPKDITAITGITANNKVYDGNTSATLNTGSAGFTGIVGGETLSVGSATGVFNSKNVVSANTVNISGLTLADGADLASNYNLTSTTASTGANITTKDITAVTGITASNKVYDGTTAATLNTGGAGFTGIIGGESLTVGAATGTFNSKDVLTANNVAISGITLADGADLASNYNLTNNAASDAAVITPRAVTITADAGQTKVFGSVDPIFAFTIGGLGLGAGDALSGALNRVAGETVGNYAINPGTLALPTPSNYILTYVSNDFGILQPQPPVTGLPNSTAGLVDLNPTLGTYTGSQLFILSLAPSAAGGESESATLPECESDPNKLAKDKDFSIMLNFGLNLPKGLNNTCI